MNALANLKTGLVKAGTKTKVFAKAKSPELLMAGAIITGVGAVVTAVIATRKVDEVMEQGKKDVQECKDALEGVVEIKEGEEYTEDDYKRDITITYVRIGLKFVKLYLPTALLMTASIASMLGSHKILSKRNAGLVGALAASDKAFKEYRKRVIDELGEDMDSHFALGTKVAQIQQTVTDEDGNEKTVTEEVTLADELNEALDTRRYFDNLSTKCAYNVPDYDMFFLNSQENVLTTKLTAIGHLYLNDVYEALGYEPTPAGQQIGWIFDPTDPTKDNCVSFRRKLVKRFVHGAWINSYILDFNHDGDILQALWDKEMSKKKNLIQDEHVNDQEVIVEC